MDGDLIRHEGCDEARPVRAATAVEGQGEEVGEPADGEHLKEEGERNEPPRLLLVGRRASIRGDVPGDDGALGPVSDIPVGLVDRMLEFGEVYHLDHFTFIMTLFAAIAPTPVPHFRLGEDLDRPLYHPDGQVLDHLG